LFGGRWWTSQDKRAGIGALKSSGILQCVGFGVTRPQLPRSPASAGDNERAAMVDEWRVKVAGLERETPVEAGRC